MKKPSEKVSPCLPRPVSWFISGVSPVVELMELIPRRNIITSEDTPGVQRCSQTPIPMFADAGTMRWRMDIKAVLGSRRQTFGLSFECSVLGRGLSGHEYDGCKRRKPRDTRSAWKQPAKQATGASAPEGGSESKRWWPVRRAYVIPHSLAIGSLNDLSCGFLRLIFLLHLHPRALINIEGFAFPNESTH